MKKNHLTYREEFKKKKKTNKKKHGDYRGLGKGDILVLNGYRVSVEEEERRFGEGRSLLTNVNILHAAKVCT